MSLCRQEDYQQWELPVQEQQKPIETFKHNLPFTGASAYAEAYHAHPLEPPHRRDAPTCKREASVLRSILRHETAIGLPAASVAVNASGRDAMNTTLLTLPYTYKCSDQQPQE